MYLKDKKGNVNKELFNEERCKSNQKRFFGNNLLLMSFFCIHLFQLRHDA